MKQLSPSLLALVAIATVPTAYGLDVKDEDLTLAFHLRTQVRAERAWSADNAGDPYNIASGATGLPDSADFYIRRLRLGFKGTYKNDYKFATIIRMDNSDRSDSSTSTSSGGRTLATAHAAWLSRSFTQDSTGFKHTVKAGLDWAFFDSAADLYSSSEYLFPSPRATEGSTFMPVRGVGVAYKVTGRLGGKEFAYGVDIQNNVNDSTTMTNGKGEGLCYTNRFEYIPYDTSEKGHMKTTESFVGATGTGVLIGLEAGINKNANISATAHANRKAEGIEVLVHHNELTALVEYRLTQLATTNNAVADTNVGSKAIIIQAGWAKELSNGTVIEPAFRWSRIDLDRDSIETSNYGSNDYGNSGFQTELGVNWYLNKHAHKIQFAYQNWRGEDSASATVENPARANILRAQWQLNF